MIIREVHVKIILIRHGETDWNKLGKVQGNTDIELNDNGRKQAEKVALTLKKLSFNIEKIYSSDLKRALGTANIINEQFNRELIATQLLREINLGHWESKNWEEIREIYSDEYTQWFVNRRYSSPKYGESYQTLLERTLDFLLTIEKTENDVLIVTHGANIMTLKSLLYRTDFSEMTQYKQSNATYSIFEYDELLKMKEFLEFEKYMKKLAERAYEFFINKCEDSNYLKNNQEIKNYIIHHTLRVAKNAHILAKEYNLDEVIMVVGSLLHGMSYSTDLSKMEGSVNHGIISAEISRDFVSTLDISDYQKQQILLGVAIHAGESQGDFAGEPSLEAKCIRDADMMDNLVGNYRIYQIFEEENFKNINLFGQVKFLERKIKEIKNEIPYIASTELATKVINEGLEYSVEFYTKLKKQLTDQLEI